MSDGTYTGKDGRTYRLVHSRRDDEWCTEVLHCDTLSGVDRWDTATLRVSDIDAAKAALDALIAAEQEAEQWVELNGYWRISTDGIKVQRRDWCDDSDPWVDTTEAPELVKLYRTGLAHGREVVLAESAELREQVRALVGAIKREDWVMPAEGMQWLRRVTQAAERVQL